MEKFKAAYILTKEELDFLTGKADNRSAEDSLIEKGFAKRIKEVFLIEPVIKLFIKTMTNGCKKYRAKNENMQASVFCSEDLCLLITKYPLLDNALKFTPYKSIGDMKDNLDIDIILEEARGGEDIC